jgi:hypothetical protein
MNAVSGNGGVDGKTVSIAILANSNRSVEKAIFSPLMHKVHGFMKVQS